MRARLKIYIFELIALLMLHLGFCPSWLLANETPETPWEYHTYIQYLNKNKLYKDLESFLTQELKRVQSSKEILKTSGTVETDTEKFNEKYGSLPTSDNLLWDLGIQSKEKEYNLEGQLYLLDDMADLYFSKLVSFKKAFEVNSRANQVLLKMKQMGLNNIPLSNYFNSHRLLFNFLYPLSLEQPEPEKASSKITFTRRDQGEFTYLNRMDLVTHFNHAYLDLIRHQDFLNTKDRIENRYKVLKEKLGLLPGKINESQRLLTREELSIALNSIDSNDQYNPYYRNYLKTQTYWQQLKIDSEPGDYLPLVQTARKALEGSKTHRIEDDHISLCYLHYWLGMAYLKTGTRNTGLDHLERFDEQIRKLDRLELEKITQKKEFVEKIAKEEEIRLREEAESMKQMAEFENEMYKFGNSVSAFLKYMLVGTLVVASSYGSQNMTAASRQSYINDVAELAYHSSEKIDKTYEENAKQLEIEFNEELKKVEHFISSVPKRSEEIKNSYQSITPRQLKYARFMNPHEQLGFYIQRADALAESEKAGEAKLFYTEAISLIEQQRSTIDSEGKRISFSNTKTNTYYKMVKLLIEQNLTGEAFNYTERAKARAFADVLASKKIHFRESDEEKYYWDTLLANVENNEILSHGSIGVDQLNLVRSNERNIQALPTFHTMPMMEFNNLDQAKPAKYEETIKMFSNRRSEEAFIEYLVLDDRVIIFLFDDHTSLARVSYIHESALAESIKEFRRHLSNPKSESYEGMKKLSRSLYEVLIKPIEDKILSKKLVISPHGPLHYVPFQALLNGNEYLIQKFSISYIPSATILRYLARKKAVGPLNPDANILLMGNPELGNMQQALPYAEMEVSKVAKSFSRGITLTREKASEGAFKKASAYYDILHLASHSEFDENDPLNSALLLSPDSLNDGRLTLAEVYQLSLKASLVVLSACQTGLGKLSAGDELIGLYRAFMYAGAHSIVGSLWSIDDASTSFLMSEFYQELKTNKLNDALRLAQLKTIETFPHPYYWSGFVLVGKN